MTLGKLIKTLQKLEEKHGSRIAVAADTRALRSTWGSELVKYDC
jgi:hypothetical protein